jgi:DNA-binding NarL/FixJ family response regulator
MARILIVDDQDMVRREVRHILETQNHWEVVGEATNGREALDMVGDAKPDAIVMDISMPVMNGLEATSEITRRNPGCKVLIFTAHSTAGLLGQIQRSGAKGLVTKSNATIELTPALHAIIKGQTYFTAPGLS